MADIKNNENEVVFTDIPSFEEINKRIDYSPLKEQRNQMIARRLLIKRIGIGFASVVLVVGGITLGTGLWKGADNDIPFSLGTYVYSSSIGDIDGVNFNESSNIVLSEEEKSGLGTFTIKNDKDDWVVYGQFYDCYFENQNLEFTSQMNNNYYYVEKKYNVEMSFNYDLNEFSVRIFNEDETLRVFFQLKN